MYFVGSSKSGPVKRKVGKDTNKFGGAKKMVIEMDKGLVTLPAKLCFVCCRLFLFEYFLMVRC